MLIVLIVGSSRISNVVDMMRLRPSPDRPPGGRFADRIGRQMWLSQSSCRRMRDSHREQLVMYPERAPTPERSVHGANHRAELLAPPRGWHRRCPFIRTPRSRTGPFGLSRPLISSLRGGV